ncbi:MAG: TerB family tellurite resistance protein [Myxococcales bacterium]|nr:TerB family tellurite resistance protein [Myxococcales bacterium]
MAKPILGRDVYLALAAVGWADGNLDREEADAIVRTALEEGLELDAINEIEEAVKKPVEMGIIDRLHMSKADRLYVYAVASWITRLDGVITPEEEAVLSKLGQQLGVPDAPRKHADSIMQEIAGVGDRPDRFDLLALRTTLEERLAQAQAVRAAKSDDDKPSE